MNEVKLDDRNFENLQTTSVSNLECDLSNLREEKKRLAAKTFIDWVVSPESSIECSAIELRYCGPNTGFGVFAKRCIRWNENLIQIPKHLIITADVVSEISEYSEILQRLYLDWLGFCEDNPYGQSGSAPTYDRNCFQNNPTLSAFLHARCCSKADKTSNWLSQNRSSSWFPAYLNILPQEFNTAIASSQRNGIPARQIEKYLPNAVCQLFKQQIAEYDHVIKQVTEALSGFHCPELFSWAWHIVNTRCIWIDPSELQWSPNTFSNTANKKILAAKNIGNDCIAVIPLVDMLNHSSNAQCIATYDKMSARYLVGAQNAAINEGSQVFVCYGPHDNARLWLEYGFRLGADNIFNRVNISTDLFIALVKHSGLAQWTDEHENVIRKAELPCTIYGSDDEPSYSFKKNCEIALLDGSQLKNWQSVVYREQNSASSAEENEVNQLDDGVRSELRIENLTKIILSYLCTQLESKLDSVDKPEFRDFWTDQTEILKRILTNYNNKNKEENNL